MRAVPTKLRLLVGTLRFAYPTTEAESHEMTARFLRVLAVLLASGLVPLLVAELLLTVRYDGVNHYLGMFIALFRAIVVPSIPIGGLVYVALTWFRIRLSVPVCIATGALVGALPGLLLWLPLWSLSYPDNASPAQIEVLRMYPLIFGAFGAIGGLTFVMVARMLRLR